MLAGTLASTTFLLTFSFWALSYDISGKLEFGDAFLLGMYLHSFKNTFNFNHFKNSYVHSFKKPFSYFH